MTLLHSISRRMLSISSRGYFKHQRFHFGISLFLVVATFAVYWQVRNYEFINLDDNFYVTENPHVFTGLKLENFLWAFQDYTRAGLWQPMVWLSYILDSWVYQMAPGGFHLTNVWIHIANSVLLFWGLFRLTAAPFRSGFVAALFALHPLHVESVAWVTERKDVLSTFFGLLTVGYYFRYVRRHTRKDYLISLLTFTLGLLSKAMLVTLPIVLLLLDYWPLQRLRTRQLLREKIPFFVLSVGVALMTLLGHHIPIVRNERISILGRISNALVSYVTYLGKMVWPQNLAVLYPSRILPLWEIVGAGLLMLSLSTLVVLLARRRPWIAMGWLWYVITLVPVIGFVQVGSQALADRFTYIPSIGIFILVVWSVPENWPGTSWLARRHWQKGLAVLAGGVVFALGVLSWRQTQYWKDSETVFKHSLAVAPESYVLHNNLGTILADHGKIEEAILHYAEANRIKPQDTFPHSNLAILLVKLGKVDEAIRHYNEALKLDSKDAIVHNNLGLALAGLGRVEEARFHYLEALKTNPSYPSAHNNLAIQLAAQGKTDEAIAHYREALKEMPNYADAHSNLGFILANQGKTAEAMSHFQEALRSNPEHAFGHYNLGTLLFNQGKAAEALGHYEVALRQLPNDSNLHMNRALALLALGNREAALRELDQVRRLNPSQARILEQKFK